ncbi:MAG: hypothetical protein LBT92_03330, partial [Rickettsiales bacterium]|nr:hypothetical protein [Rickettsiales bacterium]
SFPDNDKTIDSDTPSLALQVMLGMNIDVTENFSLDLGYKYANLGDATSDIKVDYAFTPTSGTTTHIPGILNIKDEDLRFGAFYFGGRYTF